ncbi:hypothetical protein Taro_005051 [Colocasia esculenta]|uniref:C2H2-type domain-containing protein n=1 Tax=Colocasia esculenta TaxID=4460 RepID=A0A843TLY3_COLES|nr:hypothetical protein [Colocasia esculenta]
MEAIPVVDLRLLTQAEINALSRVSSSAAGDPRRCDDVVVPKIDRSVFNESAGSRKQTYSRLRLAPRKSPELSPPASASPSSSSGATRGRRRSGGLLPPPPPSAASTSSAPPLPPLPVLEAVDDPCRRENEQIILFLRQLFAKKGIQIADKAAAPDESAVVPSAGVIANPNPVGSALGKRWREQEATEAFDKDRVLLNITGVAADLVALGEAEDPFEPELRRRTQGLVTEEDFLRFLSGLEGQWGSRRKRRRIVDADKLGDALPKGWKVLLALKRKEGNIWIHCRRYIWGMGCQESWMAESGRVAGSAPADPDPESGQSRGSHEVRQQNTAENNANKLGNGHVVGHTQQVNVTSPSSSCYSALPISAFSPDSAKQIVLYGVENSANFELQDVLKCPECNLTFADKGAHMQHFLTLHRSNRKRRRFGQSISDGVIIRDGKYECQFCHKMFTERRRYNGHVGIHVKYHDRRLEPVTYEITMEKNVNSSTDAAAPAFAEHNNSVDCGKETKLTDENVSIKSTHVISDSYPYGNEHVGNAVSDHTMKCCDNEEEKIMVQDTCNVGAIDEIKDSFPLRNSCDNEEQNVMQELFPSPNHEKGYGSPRNNVLVEERKDDDVMNCFENERNSVQEVYKAHCVCERNASFPLSNKMNKVDSFPELNIETSGSEIVKTDAGMLDQKPRDAAEAGNIVNHYTHVQDYRCSSVSDVGYCTSEGSLRNDFSNKILLDETDRPSKLNIDHGSNAIAIPKDGQASVELLTLSQSVVDGIENSENKKCPGSNLKILSVMEQSNKRNTVAICMATELVEMVKSGNEPKDDLECAHTASNRAAILENIVPGETRLFGIGERFLESSVDVPSGRKFCNVDTAINDVLPSSGEEIMLDMMGHSSNGLKDDFMSDGTVHADARRNDTGIADEGNLQSLQVNLQTSWGQASVHLPILQMITDQSEYYLVAFTILSLDRAHDFISMRTMLI